MFWYVGKGNFQTRGSHGGTPNFCGQDFLCVLRSEDEAEMADGDHSLSSALDGAVDGGGGGCSTAAPSAFLSIPAPEIKAIDEGVRKVTSSLQASPSNAGGAGSSHIITLIPALICSGPDLRFPPGGRPELWCVLNAGTIVYCFRISSTEQPYRALQGRPWPWDHPGGWYC